MNRLSFFLPVIFAASQISPSEAIVVANYSDATNLRFEDDPSFIGAPFDLSGVGRLSQLSPSDQNRVANGLTPFREGTWATALGPNYFLSANHYQPDAGSEITFRAGNSTSSNSFTYEVGGGFRVGSTDLWIGYTLTEIDSSINRYTLATQDANTLSELGLGDRPLYMSGDLLSGREGVVTDHVLGTNQAESFLNEGSGTFTVPGGGTINYDPGPGYQNDLIILFDNLPSDTDNPALFHEALLQAGDSGSPLFSASGSALTLLGVALQVLGNVPGDFDQSPGPPSAEERDATLYSYVGSYTDEINNTIAQVPDPIPEPTTALLLGFGLLMTARRQR